MTCRTSFAGLVVFLFAVLPAIGRAADSPGAGAARATPPKTQPIAVSTPSALTYKLTSNPYCYQPDPQVNQCSINIRYIQITDNGTSAPYMLRTAVSVNSKVRLNVNLFFENNIYYSFDMAPAGLTVPCGLPNAGGGGTQYGNLYYVKVEPLDSGGNSMGYDQAALYCPAFAP